MKLARSLTLGFMIFTVLAGIALTASPVQAASGPGPYYAEPAWDRKLPAASRFLILKNWNSEAVLDKETGLVWERSPATTMQTWIGALVDCTGRTTGNRKGWRLPSMPELASLVDPSVTPGPALPLGHPFPIVMPFGFWSATALGADPTIAWAVGVADGTVVTITKTSNIARAWCVRGGMNAGQY